jgi:hypothetical protein
MNKLILVILIMSGLQAYAGNDGGGGGIICFTSGKCITLAEAGLRVSSNPSALEEKGSAFKIPTPPEPPAVSEEILREVRNIIRLLPATPVGMFWFSPYNFYAGKYVRVNINNEKKFKKAKAEYAKILKSNGFQQEGFTLAAFTGQEGYGEMKTYLLPDFYRLNTHSQALILIHEAVVWKTSDARSKEFSPVKFALEFDALVLDILKGKSLDINYLTYMHETLEQSGWASRYYFLSPLLRRAYQKSIVEGQRYKLSDYDKGKDIYFNLLNNEDSYRLYKKNPDLWKILASEGVVFMRIQPLEYKCLKFDDDAILLNFDASKFCEGTEDGLYWTGAYILKCEKSIASIHSEVQYFTAGEKIVNPYSKSYCSNAY